MRLSQNGHAPMRSVTKIVYTFTDYNYYIRNRNTFYQRKELILNLFLFLRNETNHQKFCPSNVIASYTVIGF